MRGQAIEVYRQRRGGHIDVEFAEQAGIKVLTSPEGSRNAVGEHTVGLLLSMLNKISEAHTQVQNGQWVREPNRGVELSGKTVGIMGYGNMGSSFAKKLSGFECEVISYDRYKRNYADAYTTEVDLQTLQHEADIISLHFPYTSDNHYFIDKKFMDLVRKDFYLLNTARGLVLNTIDLVDGLKNGHVRGAALDVLDYEDQSFDRFTLKDLPQEFEYLCKSAKVVLTPHIAGWTVESKKQHAEVLFCKILEASGI